MLTVLILYLDISWCDMITGNGIKSLAEGCKKLQNFIAKGCMHIHDEGLLHLARNCKDLRKVNVQGCRNVQDEGVTRLAEACPNLQYLCVSNCSHLTDTSLLGNDFNKAKPRIEFVRSISLKIIKF